jgi:hypothetical protein
MQALQSRALLSSDTNAMEQLHAFLRQRREASEPVEDLERLEQELHRLFVAAEREALGGCPRINTSDSFRHSL